MIQTHQLHLFDFELLDSDVPVTSKMPRNLLVIGPGALLIGLAAIFTQPFRDVVLQQTAHYDTILSFIGLGGPPPVVFDDVRDIRYTGSRSSVGVEHFQNIFYAEDTSGINRFAPPQPIQHSAGAIIDATQAGAWCPQALGDIFPFTSRITNVSENCLSLRIARPYRTQPDAKLPVVVYIHGGTVQILQYSSSSGSS